MTLPEAVGDPAVHKAIGDAATASVVMDVDLANRSIRTLLQAGPQAVRLALCHWAEPYVLLLRKNHPNGNASWPEIGVPAGPLGSAMEIARALAAEDVKAAEGVISEVFASGVAAAAELMLAMIELSVAAMANSRAAQGFREGGKAT